ncbi:MAG: component of the Tol biopolymer transport system [Chloroflexi bacterium]|nr:MAG: component of the Tol biopolymer transport system [Chloroflexota bacterium]
MPGLAVYTKGVDLWLQRGDQAGLLLAGSQRLSLFTPVLSPDGSRVAYVRFDQAPGQADEIGSDIHILDLQSGDDLSLRVHATGGEFFWSPRWQDPATLIYSHQRNIESDDGGLFSVDIERIDLDSGRVEVLRQDAAEPDLSPDGTTLAFVDRPALDQLLGIMPLATGEARILIDSSDNLSFFRVPRFSPDGQWVAFLASGDGPLASARPFGLPAALLNGIQDVWMIRTDGSGLTRLTTVLEDTPHFSWSDDGRHILVRGAFGVYLVEVATRSTQTLGPGEFHGAHDWSDVLPTPPADDS